MKKITLFIISIFSAFSLVKAEPSFDSKKKIDQLFDLIHIEEQMTGSFDAMIPVINQMSSQYQLDAEAKKELSNIYKTWFNNDLNTDSMIAQIADIYAETFTAEEIQMLIEFYETPIGQKLIKETPELAQKGALIGMEAAQKAQPKLIEKLTPFLEKHLPEESE